MKVNVDKQKDTIEQIFRKDHIYNYDLQYKPMVADLKGRVALVTGATGMIGYAGAKRLAMSGADIIIWGRNDEEGIQNADELTKNWGVRSKYYNVELGDRISIADNVNKVLQDFGRVDIIFANAGVNIGNRRPLNEFDNDSFDTNIDINLSNNSVYLCKLLVPQMIKNGGGNIIFTSSVCGVSGLMKQCGFVASKFAINAITKSMALELGKYNIRVNAIAPGSLPNPKAKLNFL